MKDTTAVFEILKFLGFAENLCQKQVQELARAKSVELPKIYSRFLQMAWNSPLFETADVWTNEKIGLWSECLQEQMKAGVLSENQLPQEDFLQIGGDVAGSGTRVGIAKADLLQPNPPVYQLCETKKTRRWKPVYNTVSEYLQDAVLQVLTLMEYDTAETVLEEMGWEYFDCLWDDASDDEEEDLDIKSALKRKGIESKQLQKCKSKIGFGTQFFYLDEKTGILYAGNQNPDEEVLYAIRKHQK